MDDDNSDEDGNDPNGQNAPPSQDSNNSFDAVQANLAPKTAELLASCRQGSGQRV